MAVETSTNKVRYECDGITTEFSFSFKIYDDTDLYVVKTIDATGAETELTLNDDYTVTIADNPDDGGYITTNEVYGAVYTITIARILPYTQETVYVEGSDFRASVIQNDIDRNIMIDQQLKEVVDRTFKFTISSDYDPDGIEVPAVPNTVFGTDSTGKRLTAYSVNSVALTNINSLQINYSGDFNTMLALLGTTEATVVVDIATTINTNLTIPSTISLLWLQGQKATVASGVTLTIEGSILAGDYDLFDGGGTVLVTNHNVKDGFFALGSNIDGVYNTAIGSDALLNNEGGDYNTAVGANALKSNINSNSNVAVGVNSMESNTSGMNNTAIGTVSLNHNISGDDNVAVGAYALDANTSASGNTALGKSSLTSNTTGFYNTAVGYLSMYHNTVGKWNTAMGQGALILNDSGNANVSIGHESMYQNNDGSENTALGVEALAWNISGDENVAIGFYADRVGWYGYRNVAVGHSALMNTGGSDNVAIGHDALTASVSTDFSVAVGSNALVSNVSGSYNVAVGSNALHDNLNSNSNVAVGTNAMYENVSGINNTAVGTECLRSNIDGQENVAIGDVAMFENVTGDYNVAAGFRALNLNIGGNQNTAIGVQALYNNISGDYNTALGVNAGYTNTSGSNSIFIGRNAGNNASQKVDAQNSIAIGYDTYTTADNQIVIGNGDITDTYISGDLHTEDIITDGLVDGVDVSTLPGLITTVSGDLDSALTIHKSSSDHDGRYYTESETDVISGALNTKLDTHKSSVDHDGRYYTETEVITISGDILSYVSTNYIDNTEMTSISGDLSGALTSHKSSADHDGRYYTESEVNTISGALNTTITSYLNQSVKTDASPTFVTAKLTNLSDSYVPYHVSDAVGLANSSLYYDATNKVLTIGYGNSYPQYIHYDGWIGLEVDSATPSMVVNTYYSAGYKYRKNGTATRLAGTSGIFTFSTAVSGVADATVTFTERMRLDTTGLGIATNAPVCRLEVEDGATAASMILKITQDDQNVSGLVVGNDTYSTTDTSGLKSQVMDNGTAKINNYGGTLSINTDNNQPVQFGTGDTTFSGIVNSQNIIPNIDDTYYLGESTTPFKAFKAVILKDTADGKHYKLTTVSGILTTTALD